MRARKTVLFAFLVLAIASSFTALAYASNRYFYLVNSNFGTNSVPLGSTVKITASTNDSRIVRILFYWYNPANPYHPEFTQSKDVYTNGTKDVEGDTLIRYADSTLSHPVDKLGDWHVFVIFKDVWGNSWCESDKVIACRAITFNVVPEVPLLGTLGVSIAMVAGLAFRMRGKRQK